MESSTLAQLNRILADQQQGLRELRAKRKEYRERLTELDVKEVEYLLGIDKTKEAINDLEADK